MVESEFGAMSACIGASAAGARAYTATASQGLLFMAEALFNASGLGLPIVMTVANRATGAPINIWNDHSDSMSMRDSGWVQLYAESNQEAVDLHLQAFRLAEQLSLPVMVCMDGFVLTHAVEQIDIPDQAAVDAFLPPFKPRQQLDPDVPITIGAMVGPQAFTEVKYLMRASRCARSTRSLGCRPTSSRTRSGGHQVDSSGLPDRGRRRSSCRLGSVLGLGRAAVDELRNKAYPSVRSASPASGRGRPKRSAKRWRARHVIVVEPGVRGGGGGIVGQNVRLDDGQLPRRCTTSSPDSAVDR